jgi:hypothetical protein
MQGRTPKRGVLCELFVLCDCTLRGRRVYCYRRLFSQLLTEVTVVVLNAVCVDMMAIVALVTI